MDQKINRIQKQSMVFQNKEKNKIYPPIMLQYDPTHSSLFFFF